MSRIFHFIMLQCLFDFQGYKLTENLQIRKDWRKLFETKTVNKHQIIISNPEKRKQTSKTSTA